MKFLLGLAIGFVAAVLFAPAPGEETRRALGQAMEEWKGLPRKKAEEAAEAARREAGEIGAKVGRRAAESAVEALERGVLGPDEQAG